MKRLYLLRHAKSSWDDPGLADHDRPLAPRGRRAAARLALHLRAEGIRPELVLCSSAVRARQTLERISDALGDAEILVEPDLYASDADGLLERLQRVAGTTGSAMVIAHNPGLQDLALELVSSGQDLERLRERFPTGALATVRFDGAWRDLAPGAGALVGLVTPKDLR
jgi:phosphohistidine phosphatase